MVIGFRTFTDGFAYVVLAGTQEAPVVVAYERLPYPSDTSSGRSLSWLRKQLEEICNRHSGIVGACIKTIEPIAMKKSRERIEAEGVIQEFFCTAQSVECITRIKSQLKRDIVDFDEPARYLERVLEDASELSDLAGPRFAEAALAAVAELPTSD